MCDNADDLQAPDVPGISALAINRTGTQPDAQIWPDYAAEDLGPSDRAIQQLIAGQTAQA
jgi:hypothetical protein